MGEWLHVPDSVVRALCLAAFPLASSVGCAQLMNGAPGALGTELGQPASNDRAELEAGKQNLAASDRERDASSMTDELRDNTRNQDQLEASFTRAFRTITGKEPLDKSEKPVSSSALIARLQRKGVQLHVEPITERGVGIPSGYPGIRVANGDSIKRDPKHGDDPVSDWSTLGYQLIFIDTVAYQATGFAQAFSLYNLQRAAIMRSDRRYAGTELNTQDYELIASSLALAHRAETLAALATGMLATYQAVVNGRKDPKLLDSYGEKALSALPTHATPSVDEAKAFVSRIDEDVAPAKDRYAAWMREAYGAKAFEAGYKKQLDDSFALIEKANQRKTADQEYAESERKRASAQLLAYHGDPIDAVTDKFVTDSKMRASIQGVRALVKGDYQGALRAAERLVPDGPAKAALSLLSSLFSG